LRELTEQTLLEHYAAVGALENVVEGCVISFFNITQMKRTQIALHEVESKYRILFETMPQGIIFLKCEKTDS